MPARASLGRDRARAGRRRCQQELAARRRAVAASDAILAAMFRSPGVLHALGIVLAAGALGCATAGPSGAAADLDGASPSRPDADPNAPDGSPPADAMPVVPDADPYAVTFASAAPGTADSQGVSISTKFWPGWRFEVPADYDLRVRTIGCNSAGGSGTAFAALVAITGPDAMPAPLDLTGTDLVAAPTVFDVPAGSGDIRVPVDVTLGAGWYALVFGTGAFGASSPDNILITRGHRPVAGAQTPFITNQSANTWYQSTHDDLRLFVEGRRE